MGVRSRFWRFEDVSVGAEEVSSCFAQALELAIPLLQIISWNVVPGRNEIANSGADGQQRLPSEQPSVTRRCSAASIEKSTLKYQIIESYAPPAPMSGANRGLTAWPDPLRKISEARGRGPIWRRKQAIFSEQISFRAVRSPAV